MSPKSRRIAQLEETIQSLERLVTDAIRNQFAERNASEDEILGAIRTIFEEATAPKPPLADRRPSHDDDVSSLGGVDTPPSSHQDSPAPSAAEKFLADLLPHLIAGAQPRDRGKRLPTKAPEPFDGSFQTFRPWWEKLREYLHINSPSLPTDKIRIQTVGTFLKGNALTWYQMRKRARKDGNAPDNWPDFKEAMVHRFTDQMESPKDWQRMRALEYKGDIQTYLAQLEEINSRVGVTGEPLREIITKAITPEMHRSIFQRYRRLPKDDTELLDAVREVGIIEEEIALSAAQIRKAKTGEKETPVTKKQEGRTGKNQAGDAKGKDAKKDETQGKDNDPGKSKDKTREPRKDSRRTNAATDFSSLKNVWSQPYLALQGVNQESIDKWKSARKDCIRCGYDGHRVVNCYRVKDADGKTLPPAPKTDKGDEVVVSAAKRKTDDPPNSDSDDHKATKKTRTMAAAKTASVLQENWFADESEGEEESDF